jgi:hypothetical protein
VSRLDDLNTNLARIGDLIEKAIEQPDVQIEFPPPQCPNCKKINPITQFDECQEQGPFAEYLLVAHCLHCKKPFFGIPVVWATVRGRREAEQLMSEHLERMGLNDGNTD